MQTIRAERQGSQSWLWVGDVRYPAQLVRRDIPVGDDYTHRERRARVLFESGWYVSVVWGSATYSDNHDDWRLTIFTEEPCHVEVAVPWDGPWEPLGYVTADVLQAILIQMGRWPSGDPPPRWAQEGLNPGPLDLEDLPE